MKKIKITDLKPGLVSGIDVQMPQSGAVSQERYFQWSGSTLLARMKTCDITGGELKSWHHTPLFSQMEFHDDAEMFYFVAGTALMLFIDVKNQIPDINTAQIVRIKAGTQIIISEGKGHFVPVAEDNEPIHIIVVSPSMDAPRIDLPETVEGVI